MARVKLNGKDLGVVWCALWQVETTGAIKAGNNQLEIEVVNRWANRMIGDKQLADAKARTVECPPGFLGGQKFQTGRYTSARMIHTMPSRRWSLPVWSSPCGSNHKE